MLNGIPTFPGKILPLMSLKGQSHNRFPHMTTCTILFRETVAQNNVVGARTYLVQVQVDVEQLHPLHALWAILGWVQSPVSSCLQYCIANHPGKFYPSSENIMSTYIKDWVKFRVSVY